jgi:hypothetical protein
LGKKSLVFYSSIHTLKMIPKAFSGCTKNLCPRNRAKLQTDWEPLEIDRKQPHPMANNSKGKKPQFH